ncbi:hypothetical protein ABK040_007684 [Willaertia magna]
MEILEFQSEKIYREGRDEIFLTTVYSTNFYNNDNNTPLDKIKTIKYGMDHFIILTTNNNIYIYGNNQNGQLGQGSFEPSIRNVKILKENFGLIKIIECGGYSTIILNEMNEMYFSGNFRNSKYYKFPKLNNNLNNIKMLHCTDEYLYLITENEIFFTEIENYNLIVKKKKIFLNGIKDLQFGELFTVLLDKTGVVHVLQKYITTNEEEEQFTTLNLNFKIKQIAVYPLGYLLLNEFNEIFGFGGNEHGELGFNCEENKDFTTITKLNIIDNNITNIFHSYGHYNIISSKDSNLYASGKSNNGVFGICNNDCKTCEYDLGGLFDCYCIDEFTEIYLPGTNGKYIYPILCEYFLFFVITYYPLKNETDGDYYLQRNCYQKLQNKQQLNDITILLNSNN